MLAVTTGKLWLATSGLLAVVLLACGTPRDTMDGMAEAYVKLVLAMGTHDPDYVDAYYGPAEWRAAVESQPLALDTIRARARGLMARLAAAGEPEGDELRRLRHRYLLRQLTALSARAEMLQGKKLTFDQESAVLYDAVAPLQDEGHFRDVLLQLDSALPGRGSVAQRYERFRGAFVIPPERVDTVFKAAIVACKERTTRHLEFPAGESFTVEYVTDKSWSGYNWYQGSYRSLIQVNLDLPIYIDRAIDLACHEGYPGHHVYNMLLEKHLVHDHGWMEYSVYALFSPQSLIAEGSANFGIEMAFPGRERLEFEQAVLFPLAGLDASRATQYYRVKDLVDQLAYAGNEAARDYLNGLISADSAQQWLGTYSLMSLARAKQRLRFIDEYRSYVINYNLGKDIVRAYVEREADGDPARRWDAFQALLSSPRIPSDLLEP